MNYSLYRIIISMHLLFFLRNHSSTSSLSSSPLFSSTLIQLVSAFPIRAVGPQHHHHHQHQIARISAYHSLSPTVETNWIIARRRMSSRLSSTVATSDDKDVESNDGTCTQQRPIFDEKHAQKVLFVECGMFYYILLSKN